MAATVSPEQALEDIFNRVVVPSSLLTPSRQGVTVGSCCSGWCSELFAAREITREFGVPFIPVFGCDIDRSAAEVCHVAHMHTYWHEDCAQDSFLRMPQVDFFACGFPCPSYSVQGARLGIEDLRGQLIFYVIRFIAIRRPHTFVLENVSNLYHQFPEVLDLLLDLLLAIPGQHGGAHYQVSWQILNCRKHGGLPQHRERLFIVGVPNLPSVCSLLWPAEAG